MIAQIIRFSIKNRLLVLLATVLFGFLGFYSVNTISMDA
ncbi:hypothetical protein MNBD_GAMMA07-91, partial [hydrothermal vent metagenome]